MGGCYTAYIESEGKTIEWITERNSFLAEKEAKKYVEEHKILDAKIVVEDTSDKYL